MGFKRTVQRAKAEIGALDETTSGRVVAAYAELYGRLRSDLADLTQDISRARQAGETVNQQWLYRQTRWLALVEQIERESLRFAHTAHEAVRSSQKDAAQMGGRHAIDLTTEALGPAPGRTVTEVASTFNRLPVDAFERIVRNAGDGKPLARLFARMPSQNVQGARAVLEQGLALGHHPRVIARDFRQVTGTTLTQSLTIARTETMRAYRQASVETYRANSHVVTRWVWHAKLDRRTCAVCWASHGEEFELRIKPAMHVNCRCAVLPQTKTWAELGFDGIPDRRPSIERGPLVFARLSEAEQLAVLGRGKFELYRNEHLLLRDLIKTTRSAYGRSRVEKPLRDLRVPA